MPPLGGALTDPRRHGDRLDTEPDDAITALARHQPAHAPASARYIFLARGDLAAHPSKKK